MFWLKYKNQTTDDVIVFGQDPEFGTKVVEIKVMEINVPLILINVTEIDTHKKWTWLKWR